MRNVFSALVLATAFANLVPDNRAQDVRAADLVIVPAAMASQPVTSAAAVAEARAPGTPEAPPEFSWLLALGFLGVVMARRLRPD